MSKRCTVLDGLSRVNNMPTALITGVTGQDGSYLAELLLSKGYRVFGLVRRSSSPNLVRLQNVISHSSLHLLHGDLCDASSLAAALDRAQPDEVYNLAAMSHVGLSFETPIYTGDSTALGAVRLFEAIAGLSVTRMSGVRLYQASSSEMFGNSSAPQSEMTPFDPRSPYAIAKVHAYHSARLYREAYGMHASNGILMNHESPRRGDQFVTRKVTKAAARIKLGLQDRLVLGNLEARRDWGYAPDYVEAMWLMLQQDAADDYVIATGETHTVREFVAAAFAELDLDYRDYVDLDPKLNRPAEVSHLCGDASKAKRVLGWEPKIKFADLVRLMVQHDLREAQREKGSAG